MSLLEEENSQLKRTIERQGYSLSTLENEKQDLVNDVEVAKTTVSPIVKGSKNISIKMLKDDSAKK